MQFLLPNPTNSYQVTENNCETLVASDSFYSELEISKKALEKTGVGSPQFIEKRKLLLPSGYKSWDLGDHWLDEKTRKTIYKKVKRLEEMTGKISFSDQMIPVTQENLPDLYDSIFSTILSSEILEFLAEVELRNVIFKSAQITISSPNVTQSRYGIFLDKGEKEIKDTLEKLGTKYMHIDSSIRISHKLVVYLTDVEPHHGPFRVVDANKVFCDKIDELAIRKTNDRLRNGPNVLQFLPEKYRARCLFGDDLETSHPLRGDLLENEVEILGNAGRATVFNSNCVHRGGFTLRGYRAMLQINLK